MHRWVGWVLCLFGSFQHPISLVYLAITLGVFVQGIGAYSGEAIFAEEEGQILFSFERTYKVGVVGIDAPHTHAHTHAYEDNHHHQLYPAVHRIR